MATPDQVEGITKEFLNDFYKNLQEGNVQALGRNYNETSQFSWEGEQTVGPQAILQKISDLRSIGKFEVSSFSSQLRENILFILVTGIIVMEGQAHNMNFVECIVVTVSRDAQGKLESQILNQMSKLAI